MRIIKSILLYFSVLAFLLSVYQTLKYWDYQETGVDIQKELRLNVTKDNLIKEIEHSISQKAFDDAKMFLDISSENHYTIDVNFYLRQIQKEDTQFSRLQKNVRRFSKGFISGKATNTAGIAGAISADFTLVGDVRDLGKQYNNYRDGEEINELIVALSGVGIGLSVLTVGSLGSVAPAKSGVSLLKLASKTQRLTTKFQKKVVHLSKQIFDWKLFTRLLKSSTSKKQIPRAARQAFHPQAVQPLAIIAKQINSVRKSTSVSDTLHILKYIETTDDLHHLQKISLKYGTQTKGILKLLGKGALRTVRVLRKSAELLISLLGNIFFAIFSLFLMIFGRKA